MTISQTIEQSSHVSVTICGTIAETYLNSDLSTFRTTAELLMFFNETLFRSNASSLDPPNPDMLK
jgi:hypothetical protein